MGNINMKFLDIRKFAWLLLSKFFFLFFDCDIISILMKLRIKYSRSERNILWHFHGSSHDKYMSKAYDRSLESTKTNLPYFELQMPTLIVIDTKKHIQDLSGWPTELVLLLLIYLNNYRNNL